MRLLLSFALLLPFCAEALTIDRKEKLKGVFLQTGKDDDLRSYRGSTKRVFPYPSQLVLQSITAVSDRCNNRLSEMRELTSTTHACRYHSDHIIESFVEKDLKSGFTPDTDEVERFVVGKRIYDRGTYSFYELVQIFRSKDDTGRITHLIKTRMLNDAEAESLVTPRFQKSSTFESAEMDFILTDVSPTETEVRYVHRTSTNHWVLNKAFSVGQVFSSLTSSMNATLGNVGRESDRLLKERVPASTK